MALKSFVHIRRIMCAKEKMSVFDLSDGNGGLPSSRTVLNHLICHRGLLLSLDSWDMV